MSKFWGPPPTALWTGPPYIFVSNEMPYAEPPDILKIVDHTHAILGSVAIIQMLQLCARKGVATEAVFEVTFRYLFTVLDFA